MRAVQDGKLSLDQNIDRYLQFDVVHPFSPTQRIALRQLATHTPGITDRQPVYIAVCHYGGNLPEPFRRGNQM